MISSIWTKCCWFTT